ncbi:unnamed protein product [Schistosoma turkestanicum]|nr:unnamed protein product [Schistosoma turkestanicum]
MSKMSNVARLLRVQFYPSVKPCISQFTSVQSLTMSHRSFSSVSNGSVTPSDKREDLPSTSVTEKAKQATKDFGYFIIVLGGFALTGSILYAIIHELFSSKSPNGVYYDAFKICKTDSRVLDLFGSSLKAYTSYKNRGRRRNIDCDSWYDGEGRLHMAMKFYLEGNLASGVVHLEVVENDSKEFDYEYLIVETEGGFSKKQIVLRPISKGDQ